MEASVDTLEGVAATAQAFFCEHAGDDLLRVGLHAGYPADRGPDDHCRDTRQLHLPRRAGSRQGRGGDPVLAVAGAGHVCLGSACDSDPPGRAVFPQRLSSFGFGLD